MYLYLTPHLILQIEIHIESSNPKNPLSECRHHYNYPFNSYPQTKTRTASCFITGPLEYRNFRICVRVVGGDLESRGLWRPDDWFLSSREEGLVRKRGGNSNSNGGLPFDGVLIAKADGREISSLFIPKGVGGKNNEVFEAIDWGWAEDQEEEGEEENEWQARKARSEFGCVVVRKYRFMRADERSDQYGTGQPLAGDGSLSFEFYRAKPPVQTSKGNFFATTADVVWNDGSDDDEDDDDEDDEDHPLDTFWWREVFQPTVESQRFQRYEYGVVIGLDEVYSLCNNGEKHLFTHEGYYAHERVPIGILRFFYREDDQEKKLGPEIKEGKAKPKSLSSRKMKRIYPDEERNVTPTPLRIIALRTSMELNSRSKSPSNSYSIPTPDGSENIPLPFPTSSPTDVAAKKSARTNLNMRKESGRPLFDEPPPPTSDPASTTVSFSPDPVSQVSPPPPTWVTEPQNSISAPTPSSYQQMICLPPTHSNPSGVINWDDLQPGISYEATSTTLIPTPYVGDQEFSPEPGFFETPTSDLHPLHSNPTIPFGFDMNTSQSSSFQPLQTSYSEHVPLNLDPSGLVCDTDNISDYLCDSTISPMPESFSSSASSPLSQPSVSVGVEELLKNKLAELKDRPMEEWLREMQEWIATLDDWSQKLLKGIVGGLKNTKKRSSSTTSQIQPQEENLKDEVRPLNSGDGNGGNRNESEVSEFQMEKDEIASVARGTRAASEIASETGYYTPEEGENGAGEDHHDIQRSPRVLTLSEISENRDREGDMQKPSPESDHESNYHSPCDPTTPLEISEEDNLQQTLLEGDRGDHIPESLIPSGSMSETVQATVENQDEDFSGSDHRKSSQQISLASTSPSVQDENRQDSEVPQDDNEHEEILDGYTDTEFQDLIQRINSETDPKKLKGHLNNFRRQQRMYQIQSANISSEIELRKSMIELTEARAKKLSIIQNSTKP